MGFTRGFPGGAIDVSLGYLAKAKVKEFLCEYETMN